MSKVNYESNSLTIQIVTNKIPTNFLINFFRILNKGVWCVLG